MKFTPLQALVAKHYAGGEFSHLQFVDDLENCGDTLFSFCIQEAGDAGTNDHFWHMLTTAIEQLRDLQGELK